MLILYDIIEFLKFQECEGFDTNQCHNLPFCLPGKLSISKIGFVGFCGFVSHSAHLYGYSYPKLS